MQIKANDRTSRARPNECESKFNRHSLCIRQFNLRVQSISCSNLRCNFRTNVLLRRRWTQSKLRYIAEISFVCEAWKAYICSKNNTCKVNRFWFPCLVIATTMTICINNGGNIGGDEKRRYRRQRWINFEIKFYCCMLYSSMYTLCIRKFRGESGVRMRSLGRKFTQEVSSCSP